MTEDLKCWLESLANVVDYALMEIDNRVNVDLGWERSQIKKLKDELYKL